MRKMKTILLAFFLLLGVTAFSQGTFSGKVLDGESNETLIGATLVLSDNPSVGAVTDTDGNFSIKLNEGDYNFKVSYVGYAEKFVDMSVIDGKTSTLTIYLTPSAVGLKGIEIMADRATERKTPVAVSNLDKKQVEQLLGSQDVPLVLNVTPNVYSTMQGGGAGDARINVRGFNQNNVAIMINGIPVNDMENGWVYWSNWDGIGDATSSIQMQRGLSAVNLATPSIGGTMNVITNPAEMKKGLIFKQEYGSGQFLKTTIFGHTGLINKKYAFSAGAVRKTGNGVIDRTWTDAWAYYFGASWNVTNNHRLELYAIGAPQRHGQNLYKQNIAAYDQEYAKELGYTQEALDAYPESYRGRLYNENWGSVDAGYTGQQYWNGKARDRYALGYINERENYYHKPLTNLNWYAVWNDKLTQFTSLYYSGGKGGGTGTYGSMKWDYSGPSRYVDFNATVDNNMNNVDSLGNDLGSAGILRNSVNNQWTVGVISKVKWEVSDNFKMSFGIDGRTAKIDHFREVRDLLGGSYFGWNDQKLGLGDKFDYNFTNDVNWLGGYVQGEYTIGIFTAYAMGGYSGIQYNYTNHFDNITAETDWIGGYQVKGGVNFNVSPSVNVFANAGYVSKVPIFDAVISDRDGTIADDPKNEKFTSFEGGMVWAKEKVAVRGNLYYTLWKDRTRNIGVILEDGSEGYVFITGMGQRHYGLELEGNYNPTNWLELLLAGSVNNWTYTNNVTGVYKDYEGGSETEVPYEYYVKDLKVGDAPQTQLVYGVTVKPVKGLRAQLLGRYYANHYADWDPFTRDDVADEGVQVWKTPAYNVFDLHASYDFPMEGSKVGLQVFAHVFNLFDNIYIQDAVDNSPYNGYYGDNDQYAHTAMSSEVFLGLPRTFNVGLLMNIR